MVVDENGLDCLSACSTTFRRKDLQKGFEPDSCFYFAEAARMRGKSEVDMAADPPPELILET